MMKGLARTFVAFSKPALVPGLGLNRKVPSLALAHARRHFGINRKTTFKILPGQDPKEAHSNYADPMEKEEGEIDFRNWLGKFPPKKEEVPFGEWSLESKRCGALGRKMGMMKVWDARGIQIPLTVVRLENCQVIDIKKRTTTRAHNHKVNLLLGAGSIPQRELNKAQMVMFRKAGIEPKEKLAEFNVSLDAILPVGTKLDVRHFVPGQFLDIVGTSRDKGFQGVMKRHNFSGQRATHGVSLTHRAPGSTGACQNPSKVWKGKKMPGHMGNNRMTIFNIQLYKIDIDRNLLFLKGSLPGNRGTWVQIRDAVRKPWIEQHPPPFPTFDAEANKDQEGVNEIIMDVSHLGDPFAYG
mmetsp:Transcript_2083/g.3805  ORF Transcript_2083/g.3805 Transcript_2083/m.3805 type:complete len:354 (-) Transcript_2083:56-1117(-)|eukprot:CAMPEP_0175088022 /NCGR_PEP_ID=MMETSP0086_2-20121207/30_1 /TAXON_ID=136419 /ORGANISM="Unknown Unknown, Strain D1" /LENGTH=353 /DNA_ID=CAMNT_0016360435 /DNA_START=70 /DNA_END=1131 /DNA_ORIENTATION=+